MEPGGGHRAQIAGSARDRAAPRLSFVSAPPRRRHRLGRVGHRLPEIAFNRSTGLGKLIRRQLSGNGKKLTLEPRKRRKIVSNDSPVDGAGWCGSSQIIFLTRDTLLRGSRCSCRIDRRAVREQAQERRTLLGGGDRSRSRLGRRRRIIHARSRSNLRAWWNSGGQGRRQSTVRNPASTKVFYFKPTGFPAYAKPRIAPEESSAPVSQRLSPSASRGEQWRRRTTDVGLSLVWGYAKGLAHSESEGAAQSLTGVVWAN